MELVIFLIVVAYFVLGRNEGKIPAHTGKKQWTATFKNSRLFPPMTVVAESEGLAVRELMRRKVDYRTIATLDAS